jgi:hypothetical protein
VRKKAKKRPGRPSAAGGRVKLTTTLAPATVKWLRVMGSNSVARAIEDLMQSELRRAGDFWEKLAKVKGSWDESMAIKPDNQPREQT